MVITSRVRTTFFVPTSTRSQALIRLPPSVVVQYETKCQQSGKVIATCEKPPHRINIWSSEEHERFLHGLELWPNGPWKEVAAIVGTKTTRQTMTHAQKYRQKIERRLTERPRQSKKRAEARQLHLQAQRLSTLNDSSGYRVASVILSMGPLPGNLDKISTAGYCYNPEPSSINYTVSSPIGVSDDIVDSSQFDQEFEALLATLEPLPRMPESSSRYQF